MENFFGLTFEYDNIYSFLLSVIILASLLVASMIALFIAGITVLVLFCGLINIIVDFKYRKELTLLKNFKKEQVVVFYTNQSLVKNKEKLKKVSHTIAELQSDVSQLHRTNKKFKSSFTLSEEVKEKIKENSKKPKIVKIPEHIKKEYKDFFKNKEWFGVMGSEIENDYFEAKNSLNKINTQKKKYFEDLKDKSNSDEEIVQLFEKKIEQARAHLKEKEEAMFFSLKNEIDEELNKTKMITDEKDYETNLKTFNELMTM